MSAAVVEDNLAELLEELLVVAQPLEERVVEPDLRGGRAIALGASDTQRGQASMPCAVRAGADRSA